MSFENDMIMGGELRSEPVSTGDVDNSNGSVAPHSVQVSNPEHHGKGRQRHTTYLVKTKYSNGSEKNVRRRYSDFIWLQKRLVEERAGNIVPKIPHKIANVKTKFDDDFVNEREKTLQRFMNRVVDHPDLPKATSFTPFLSENASDWEATKSKSSSDVSIHSESDDKSQVSNDSITINVENAQTAQKPGRFANWMTKARTKIALKLGDPKLEETPAEGKKFEDLATYADHLETCVKVLTEDASALLDAYKVQGEKLKTMAAAFSELWGEHKLSNASSSTMYQRLGDCWSSLSSVTESQHSMGIEKLEMPLKELEQDVAALKHALAQRKEALYRYTNKVNIGNTKELQLERLKSKDDLSSHQDKYFELEADLKQNDTEKRLLSDSVEVISCRLLKDADRFRQEFHEKMRETMEIYHLCQWEHAEKSGQIWKDLMPSLAKNALDTSAAPESIREEQAPTLQIDFSTLGAKARTTFEGQERGSFDSVELDSNTAEDSSLPPPAPVSSPPPNPPSMPPPVPPSQPPPPPPASSVEEAVPVVGTEVDHVSGDAEESTDTEKDVVQES